MKNYVLPLILLSACTVVQPATVTQASTGCVSDPLAPGDDDVVGHCPPPNSQQLAAATLSYAQGYAADNHIQDPTYDVSGGCGENAHGGMTCVVVLWFGGQQHITFACNSPDDQSSTPSCVVVDHS